MANFKQKGKALAETKTQTRRAKQPRLNELVECLELKNKFTEMRVLPGTFTHGEHWFSIEYERDGKTLQTRIPKVCLAYDPETQERDSTKNCPYCKIGTYGKDGNASFSVKYHWNVIVRSLQEDMPKKNKITSAEKESGIKDIESDSYTPVRLLTLSGQQAKTLQDLGERNFATIKGTKKSFDITDKKFGIDIAIKYDKDVKGPQKHTIDKGERTPLTEEELAYLVQDMDKLPQPDSLKDAKEEAAQLAKKLVGASEDYDGSGDEDEDDEDSKPKKGAKGKKPAASSKKKKDEDEEEDDESEDEDDESEDDEDEKPKKGGKASSKKSSKKSKDEDEDDEEEDDEEEEEEEEDEKPKGKSSKKPTSKKPAGKTSKKSSKDEDEDDGDDLNLDEDDEEEDEKPKKTVKKKK